LSPRAVKVTNSKSKIRDQIENSPSVLNEAESVPFKTKNWRVIDPSLLPIRLDLSRDKGWVTSAHCAIRAVGVFCTMNSPSSVTELTQESHTLERAGDIAAALQRAEQAVEQARTAGSPLEVAVGLNCVAFHHFRMGHYGQARALAKEALSGATADTPTRVDSLLMPGMCATETSDLAAGEDFFLRAIDLSRQLGYHRGMVRGLQSLSVSVYMPRGQFELSLTASAEALRLAKEQGVRDLVWAHYSPLPGLIG
jgi:hypothetical protein